MLLTVQDNQAANPMRLMVTRFEIFEDAGFLSYTTTEGRQHTLWLEDGLTFGIQHVFKARTISDTDPELENASQGK